MQPLSLSQIQSRLKEQDLVDHLSSLYFQLIEEQKAYRAQLQAARTLHALLDRLTVRVTLAEPAIRRHASLPEETEQVSVVSPQATGTGEATHGDGGEHGRTSTSSLCAAALAIAEDLFTPHNTSDTHPSLSENASCVDEQRCASHTATLEGDGVAEEISEGDPPRLMYAPTFAAIIPTFLAELAVEESVASFPTPGPTATDVDAGNAGKSAAPTCPQPGTRLQRGYALLQSFVSPTHSSSPRSPPSAGPTTTATSPHERFHEALHAYTKQLSETGRCRLSTSDVTAHLQMDAIAVASGLLSLLLPTLQALDMLLPHLMSTTLPWHRTSDLLAPLEVAAPLTVTTDTTSDVGVSRLSARASWTELSSERGISPTRSTCTFLAANESPLSSPHVRAYLRPRPPPSAPHTPNNTSSPAHQRHRGETRMPSSPSRHETTIYREATGCVDKEVDMGTPEATSRRDDALWRWSGLFWCRTLAHLLLHRVVHGLRVCEAFDAAYNKYRHLLAGDAGALPDGTKGQQTDTTLPRTTSPPRCQTRTSAVPSLTPFSCLHAAWQLQECAVDVRQCRHFIRQLFPSTAAGDCAEARVLFDCLTQPVEDGPVLSIPSAVRAALSVKWRLAAPRACAFPPPWDTALLRAAVMTLTDCLVS